MSHSSMDAGRSNHTQQTSHTGRNKQTQGPRQSQSANRQQRPERTQKPHEADRSTVSQEARESGDSAPTMLKGLSDNYGERLHGNDAIVNAYNKASDPLKAAVMATEGQVDESQLGQESTHLSFALQGLAEGREDSQWARPYAENLARMAWYDQVGRDSGMQPSDAPPEYMQNWFNAFSSGDSQAPLVGLVQNQMQALGAAPPGVAPPSYDTGGNGAAGTPPVTGNQGATGNQGTTSTQGATSGGAPKPGVEGMLADARALTGQSDADAGVAAYTRQTLGQGQPWCAAFAMNMLRDHGINNLDGLSNPNYCPSIANWSKSEGTWGAKGDYTPKAGDAILFDWEGDGTQDHIGLVDHVENGRVYTIEGNSTNGRVAQNSYALNAASINGYVKT